MQPTVNLYGDCPMKPFAVIGDIHGCLKEFEDLVSLIRSSHPTCSRIICLGDFLDKGPFGPECVRFAREQGIESVLGNHEDWGLRWIRHEQIKTMKPGYVNPMRVKIPEDIHHLSRLSQEDVAWLASLPVHKKIDDYIIVHGGLQPGKPLSNQDPSKMIRLRWVDGSGNHVPVDYSKPRDYLPPGVCYWSEKWDGDFHVIYGHEAHFTDKPRIDTNSKGFHCYGIDTAVVHGGYLTSLVVSPDNGVSFLSVPARKVYLDADAHRDSMVASAGHS
jgi:hypothetical protein